jgi:hypothetical protein
LPARPLAIDPRWRRVCGAKTFDHRRVGAGGEGWRSSKGHGPLPAALAARVCRHDLWPSTLSPRRWRRGFCAKTFDHQPLSAALVARGAAKIFDHRPPLRGCHGRRRLLPRPLTIGHLSAAAKGAGWPPRALAIDPLSAALNRGRESVAGEETRRGGRPGGSAEGIHGEVSQAVRRRVGRGQRKIATNGRSRGIATKRQGRARPFPRCKYVPDGTCRGQLAEGVGNRWFALDRPPSTCLERHRWQRGAVPLYVTLWSRKGESDPWCHVQGWAGANSYVAQTRAWDIHW